MVMVPRGYHFDRLLAASLAPSSSCFSSFGGFCGLFAYQLLQFSIMTAQLSSPFRPTALTGKVAIVTGKSSSLNYLRLSFLLCNIDSTSSFCYFLIHKAEALVFAMK